MKKIKKYPLLSDAFNKDDINKAVKVLKSKKLPCLKKRLTLKKYFHEKYILNTL